MLDNFDKKYTTYINEAKKTGLDGKACWKGYRQQGTKKKGGKTVDNCVKVGEGLWANINKKKKSGRKSASKGSKAYKAAVKAGDKLEATKESIATEKNAQCTGPTKKASSTSKGKKWMKCVKSDSGGYKRIHWGQKGVKVSGKANTKRRKSFRARHKCSTAKSNTPRGQACKDW